MNLTSRHRVRARRIERHFPGRLLIPVKMMGMVLGYLHDMVVWRSCAREFGATAFPYAIGESSMVVHGIKGNRYD